jgi:hypothetical protein
MNILQILIAYSLGRKAGANNLFGQPGSQNTNYDPKWMATAIGLALGIPGLLFLIVCLCSMITGSPHMDPFN